MKTNALRAAGTALAVALASAVHADPPLLDLATFPRAALEIVQPVPQPARRFHFDVWVADTPARAEQGLMFVRDLPAGRGMVFPFEPARVATFWMRNTYIELDLLFIAADGRVAKIIERAAPLRDDRLSSDVRVGAVLELRGGEVGLLGLRVGDQVSWKPAGKASAP
ncbi:MAG TPA: DUF192 domain-containing protein [Steroidobacteraceae bacterium]|nr:DUF192 domain-containing protein [Steroidobacteraceae bacterium]